MFIKGCMGLWFFFWGHLFALLFYDKKWLRGRWFSGKMHGICSPGWQWVVFDSLSRITTPFNKDVRFPVVGGCTVICPNNIQFEVDDLNNFQSVGSYYQAIGVITIGKGTFIGPNVGLITANHDPANPNNHLEAKPISLGEKCWIGMNSVILPGVCLGPNTTVGAGSVVTKSFPDGECIIAGNPAKIIRKLNCN